jgi:hypothetical protein
MKRQLGMALLVSCAASLGVTSMTQAAQTIALDTHVEGSAEAAGPVASPLVLTTGERYYVIVTGTVSIWPASQWSAAGSACGASEDFPEFPSPGATNGPVGWDAETVFAVPPEVNFFHFTCVTSEIPFQSTQHSPGGFQLSTAGSFAHMTPIGGERSTPTAEHSYTYQVIGSGAPAAFRFVDDPVSDDYGVLMIKVLTAAECAAIGCEASAAASADQTVVPTTGGKGAVLGASLVRLPSRCYSRRSFPVHFRVPRGVAIVKIAELINGHLVRSFGAKVSKRLVTAGVNLKGLPAGTFTMELRLTSSRGQALRARRTYHTCRPGHKVPAHHS